MEKPREKTEITISANTRDELASRMQDMIGIGWVLEEYNADNLTARMSMYPDVSPPTPPRRIDG